MFEQINTDSLFTINSQEQNSISSDPKNHTQHDDILFSDTTESQFDMNNFFNDYSSSEEINSQFTFDDHQNIFTGGTSSPAPDTDTYQFEQDIASSPPVPLNGNEITLEDCIEMEQSLSLNENNLKNISTVSTNKYDMNNTDILEMETVLNDNNENNKIKQHFLTDIGSKAESGLLDLEDFFGSPIPDITSNQIFDPNFDYTIDGDILDTKQNTSSSQHFTSNDIMFSNSTDDLEHDSLNLNISSSHSAKITKSFEELQYNNCSNFQNSNVIIQNVLPLISSENENEANTPAVQKPIYEGSTLLNTDDELYPLAAFKRSFEISKIPSKPPILKPTKTKQKRDRRIKFVKNHKSLPAKVVRGGGFVNTLCNSTTATTTTTTTTTSQSSKSLSASSQQKTMEPGSLKNENNDSIELGNTAKLNYEQENLAFPMSSSSGFDNYFEPLDIFNSTSSAPLISNVQNDQIYARPNNIIQYNSVQQYMLPFENQYQVY